MKNKKEGKTITNMKGEPSQPKPKIKPAPQKPVSQMDLTVREIRQLIKYVKYDQNKKEQGSEEYIFLNSLRDKLQNGLRKIVNAL